MDQREVDTQFQLIAARDNLKFLAEVNKIRGQEITRLQGIIAAAGLRTN